MLTNSMPLKEGEELILEIAAKGKKDDSNVKRTWRDAHKDSLKHAVKDAKRTRKTT